MSHLTKRQFIQEYFDRKTVQSNGLTPVTLVRQAAEAFDEMIALCKQPRGSSASPVRARVKARANKVTARAKAAAAK